MINRQITVGLAMVVSAALGAAAVQTLHAQAKPPAYNVAEITIKDQDGYNKEYLPVITKALTDAGGKFIVRGGKPTKALVRHRANPGVAISAVLGVPPEGF